MLVGSVHLWADRRSWELHAGNGMYGLRCRSCTLKSKPEMHGEPGLAHRSMAEVGQSSWEEEREESQHADPADLDSESWVVGSRKARDEPCESLEPDLVAAH